MRDILTPEERRLIDAAVAAGRVRVIPRGTLSTADDERIRRLFNAHSRGGRSAAGVQAMALAKRRKRAQP